MRRKFAQPIGLLELVGAGEAASADWPELPSHGFISGRRAQNVDVQNGDAIFVVGGDVISKPLPVKIPQYAYLQDNKQRGILVQAQEAEGKKLFGGRCLDGV